MSTLGKALGKIGEVLGRRDDVRVKALVEKKIPQAISD
jgi:hypothetical protein